MTGTPLPPALAAALRRVEDVFRGMTAPPAGCSHCYGAEELALLAVPYEERWLRYDETVARADSARAAETS
ncbi:hypothetical protein [Streptomyces sp. NPDC127092]|uniref:hypothetical protein n=1 Tax=Streptomyces sp. NPDC127092 TaxID=3347135 RepID=UPI00364756FB